MGKKYQPNRESYTAGTSALAYSYVPEPQAAPAPPVKREKGTTTGAQTAARQATRYSINPVYTMVLVSLVFLMLLICVMMLKAQFTVADTSEQIIRLKQELTVVRRENAHLESMINEELDLVEIKRIAMEEYGMVYPTDGDVVAINAVDSSYTVQYAPIKPKVKETATVGNVLAFITRGW